MFISIVIPTYQRPDYLLSCLKALREQIGNDQHTEIIVIDDGSCQKDASANQKICAEHRCSYFHQGRNRGMAVARNTGIANSKGEWVVFLDDDVRINENWFSSLVPLLKEMPLSVPGIEGQVKASGNGVWDREVQNLDGKAYLTCHFILRRSILNQLSGFDQEFEFLGPFCEDHELAARVLMWGEIYFSNRISVTHLPRKINLLRYLKNAPKRIRGLLKAEFYFYRKHPDRYHLFRRASTFWGTYFSIMFRNIINDFRRRRISTLIRHPFQTVTLAASCIIEQITAMLMAPGFFKTWVSCGSGLISRYADMEKTARLWDKNNLVLDDMRLSGSPLKSLLFKFNRKPVYDCSSGIKKLACGGSPVKSRIFLRVDDVFFDNRDHVSGLCGVMKSKGFPYLAAVKGDDLIDNKGDSILSSLCESGAVVGLHGFSHQGKYGPFPSELLQIRIPEFLTRLSEIERSGGTVPRILVPPFNAIGLEQIVQLSKHFSVICGGPETARFTGRVTGPVAVAGTWYFPSFYPWYGSAESILSSGVIEKTEGCFVCLTVHLSVEARDNFRSLKRLLESLPHEPLSWDFFLREPQEKL